MPSANTGAREFVAQRVTGDDEDGGCFGVAHHVKHRLEGVIASKIVRFGRHGGFWLAKKLPHLHIRHHPARLDLRSLELEGGQFFEELVKRHQRHQIQRIGPDRVVGAT